MKKPCVQLNITVGNKMHKAFVVYRRLKRKLEFHTQKHHRSPGPLCTAASSPMETSALFNGKLGSQHRGCASGQRDAILGHLTTNESAACLSTTTI